MADAQYQRTVPAEVALLVFEYLQSRGHDPELVLGMEPPSADPEQQHRVDVRQWQDMLERVAVHLDEPHLGLHLGEMISARHLGVVGHLLWACENFGAVLDRLERYQRLIFDAVPMRVREGQHAIEVAWDISEFRTGALVGEAGFAIMVQFCRNAMSGPADPHSIDFAHPPPDDMRPYEAFFNCPVSFMRPEPIIRLRHDLLTRPLQRTDTALEQILEQHAERLLAKLPKQEAVVSKVRKAVASSLRNGEPDISKVSRMLNCSARTLQRRLREAGTGFREELNLVRNELAKSYLQDRQLQITDVAQLLGYSEHSAFTRAFRKQNGQSPAQARADLTATRQ